MTVSDTHADTTAEADVAVALRHALMASLSVTGPSYYTHDTFDEAMAALDALVVERDRLQRIVDGVKSKTALDVVAEKMAAEDERDRERARADALVRGLRGELEALREHEEWLERSIAVGAGAGAWERRLLASIVRLRSLADAAVDAGVIGV